MSRIGFISSSLPARVLGLLPKRVRALVGACLGVVVACTSEPKQPEPPELGRTWRSTHFAYHSRADDDGVCEGVLETLEAHYRSIHEVLGLDSGKRIINYYKYRDAQDLRRYGHCSKTSSSCFFSSLGIETSQALERHELVHAYLSPLGDSHKLLEEGIAEALSCGSELRTPVDVDWRVAFSARRWRTADVDELRKLYAAGSWFVAHLLRELGPQRFLRFYSKLQPNEGASQAAADFEAVYGLSLAAVWRQALVGEEPEGACVYAFECSPFASAGGPACEHSSSFRALDLSAEQWVREEGGVRSMRLVRCGDSPGLPHLVGTDPWQGQVHGQLFHYVPGTGRYFYEPDANRGRLGLHPLRTHFGRAEECSGLKPWSSSGERSLLFAIGREVLNTFQPQFLGAQNTDTESDRAVRPAASAQPVWSLRWLEQRLSKATMYRVECAEGLELQACSSCSADCRTICDSDVRVSTFHVKSEITFRGLMREPADAWFRLHRVDR